MDIGDIAILKVKRISESGAIMDFPADWAKDHEIILPETEQIEDIKVGEEYVVIISYDDFSDRSFVSQRIDQFLLDTDSAGVFMKGDKVDVVPYAFTPLGAKAVINKKYLGLLYKNEIFRELKLGERTVGYVKNIRDDGKIDVTLQKQGYQQVQGVTGKILVELRNAGGFLPFNDKNSPESIRERFNISKKVFKQAIGALYKQKNILITDKGIKIV